MEYFQDSYVRKSRMLRNSTAQQLQSSQLMKLKAGSRHGQASQSHLSSPQPLYLSLPNIGPGHSPIRPPTGGARPRAARTPQSILHRSSKTSLPQRNIRTAPYITGGRSLTGCLTPKLSRDLQSSSSPRPEFQPSPRLSPRKLSSGNKGSTLNTWTRNRLNYMNTLPPGSTSSMKALWDVEFLNTDSTDQERRSTCPSESNRGSFFPPDDFRDAEDEASIDSAALMEISRALHEKDQGSKLFVEDEFSSVEMQRLVENANLVEETVRGARTQSSHRQRRIGSPIGLGRSVSGSDSDGSRSAGSATNISDRIGLRDLYNRRTRGWEEDGNLPGWVTQRPEFPGYESFIKTKRLSDALKSKPSVRKEEQIDLILRWLTENMRGAEDYSDQQLRAIAYSAALKECNKGEMVLYKGEAFQFLVVVKGSCCHERRQQSSRNMTQNSHSSHHSDDSTFQEILKVGDCFGRHVIDQGAPTVEGTIRAAEPGTEVLMLIKSNYDSQLKNYHNVDKVEAYKCLRKVELFRSWPRSRLERVCHQLHKRDYGAGEVVFKQGDPPNHVFFIQSGSVEVLKEFEVLTTNRWPVGAHAWKEKNCKTIQSFHLFTMEGPGNFFGEKSIVNNCQRTATIKTITDCGIYVLGREEFIKLLMQGKALEQALQVNKYPTDSDLKHLFTSMKIKEKHKQNVTKLLNQSGSLKRYSPASGIAWLQQKDIDLYLRNTQTKAKQKKPSRSIIFHQSSRFSSSQDIQSSKPGSPKAETKLKAKSSGDNNQNTKITRASQSFRHFSQSIEDGKAMFDSSTSSNEPEESPIV